ncbi:family 43 glycosylhydrolase [Micromonospora sp. CPCC 206061]|uniref:family 43 glycosylhydrolase n=1 Tax=Micromonospora sp. CPCC 206061 TaxID=3122410 RepID=UPI002FF4004E
MLRRLTTRRRKYLAMASATAVVATALAAASVISPVANAATIDPSAFYQLVARHSGKALTIAGGSTADGAGVVQQSTGAGASQQFQFVDAGGGFYRLRARHSGKVIDVEGRSTADGANVIQWSDTGGTNQQWSVVDTDSGYVQLINRNSGKALDVWEWSTADGARLSQYTDSNGNNQQFLLVRVGGASPSPSTPSATGTPTVPPASYPNPGAISGDTGAHDPTVVKTPSGGYILAATGRNLALKTSTDRRTWRGAGAVWPNGAPWTTSYTNGGADLWAPDISYHNGQYYLYYSASTFGSQRSAIFLATSSTGASGSWTNQGLIIESSASVNYNAIDPNLIVDAGGQWWLSFGSFWSGIKMIRLDPATGKRSTSDTAVRSLSGRPSNGGAVEAPVIYQRGGFYYLWVSFDRCCQGASSTYRIMVGRSTSITGPYTDRNGVAMTSGGGTQVLAGHGSIHGPGHQAVIADSDGDVLFYHYYANNGAPFLGINRIGYDSAGWPFVY